MEKVTIGYMEMMRQAKSTAQTYMVSAVKEIDKMFGEGYAEKNPALVAAFMNTCVNDFNGCANTQVLQHICDELSELKLFHSEAMEGIRQTIGEIKN